MALQPSTGGTFIVDIYYSPSDAASAGTGEDEMLVQRHVLWDRKVEGGFPGKQFCFFTTVILKPTPALDSWSMWGMGYMILVV